MTGYLERLAARASGAMAAVAPRLPSRFESPSPALGSAFDAARVAEPTASPVVRHPITGTGREATPATSAISATSRGADGTTRAASSSPDADSSRRAHAEPVLQPTEVASMPVANAEAELRDAIDTARETDRAGDRRPSEDRHDAPEAPDRAGPRAVVSARPVERPADSARGPAQGSPAATAPATRHPLGRPSEPDVVHVSIGRVEVRATLAAPRPEQPTARTPSRGDSTVSLEDYLKGRRPT
jgi:hypothetical protein